MMIGKVKQKRSKRTLTTFLISVFKYSDMRDAMTFSMFVSEANISDCRYMI